MKVPHVQKPDIDISPATRGTPTTLRDAIQNGVQDSVVRAARAKGWPPMVCDVVEIHVLDFLHQKFGAAYLRADEAAAPILKALALEIGVQR